MIGFTTPPLLIGRTGSLTDPASLGESLGFGDSIFFRWAMAAAVLAVGVLVASMAKRGLVRFLDQRSADTAHAEKLLGRIVQVVILLFALVYALGAVGVQITPLLGALGLGGLALAFVVQPALLNLFSGVLLHFHRPLRVGEEIQTGDVEGEVYDVTSRSVVIEGHSGEMVFVPNSVVLEREVFNFTRAGKRRSTVVVGVAYGTNIGRARSILEGAAMGAEGVRSKPPVQVYAVDFADSAINFEVDFWHDTDERSQRRTRDRVIEAIDDALAEASITIPFPQRTVWMGDRVEAETE